MAGTIFLGIIWVLSLLFAGLFAGIKEQLYIKPEYLYTDPNQVVLCKDKLGAEIRPKYVYESGELVETEFKLFCVVGNFLHPRISDKDLVLVVTSFYNFETGDILVLKNEQNIYIAMEYTKELLTDDRFLNNKYIGVVRWKYKK